MVGTLEQIQRQSLEEENVSAFYQKLSTSILSEHLHQLWDEAEKTALNEVYDRIVHKSISEKRASVLYKKLSNAILMEEIKAI